MSALARLGPFFASTRQLTTSAARYQTSTPPAAASLAQVAPTSDETPAAAAAESSLAGREVSHPAAAAAAASRIPPPLPPPVPEPVEPAPVARVRRPIGAFRGGLIGFLLGVTAVGGFGYFQLLDDYTKASSLLLMSVEELKSSTEQMASHIQRIERVEAEVEKLGKNASTKKDVASLRKEYTSLLESEHLDSVELRARVWGIEQDLHLLAKAANSTVRI